MDDDNSLDIFKITTWNTKLVKEFVKRELLISQRYQVDVNKISVVVNGAKNMKPCSL
jgi:hypothetical protein